MSASVSAYQILTSELSDGHRSGIEATISGATSASSFPARAHKWSTSLGYTRRAGCATVESTWYYLRKSSLTPYAADLALQSKCGKMTLQDEVSLGCNEYCPDLRRLGSAFRSANVTSPETKE